MNLLIQLSRLPLLTKHLFVAYYASFPNLQHTQAQVLQKYGANNGLEKTNVNEYKEILPLSKCLSQPLKHYRQGLQEYGLY